MFGIRGMLVVGLVWFLIAIPSAYADVTCTPAPDGTEICTAGLRSDIAGSIYATQGDSQWCWAASIAMVFRHYGYNVTQEDIVADAWGGIVNMPGTPRQILASLNREWTDRDGNRFRVSGDVYSANPATAAQDLAGNQPLIIGTMGHAMVLTAVTYVRDAFGGGSVVSAVVRDPWPGEGRRDLRADEWYGTMLLVRIRVEPVNRSHVRCVTRNVPCSHQAHPAGDAVPCTHPAHRFDATPCMHQCFVPGWGPAPCHPEGDAGPCMHPAHPSGDGIVPCSHALHGVDTIQECN